MNWHHVIVGFGLIIAIAAGVAIGVMGVSPVELLKAAVAIMVALVIVAVMGRKR